MERCEGGGPPPLAIHLCEGCEGSEMIKTDNCSGHAQV